MNFNAIGNDGKLEKVEVNFNKACLFGWAGRNQEEVKKHALELAEHGIRGPKNMPEHFLISPAMMGQQEEITCIGDGTCGEIEFFFFIHNKEIYVGVGSEHTDRSLEAVDMIKSKAICEKVMSKNVWRYSDVKNHWDDLRLTAWQHDSNGDILYQDSPLGTLLSLEDLKKEALKIYDDLSGVIIWSGTIPTLGGLVYGDKFWGQMEDPILKRKIDFGYNIIMLPSDD